MATVRGVSDSGNTLIDSLAWGTRWYSGSGTTVIKVGYSTAEDGAVPTSAELAAMNKVFALYESFLNIDIQYIGHDTTGAADINFNFNIYASEDPEDVLLGVAEPPGEDFFETPNENTVFIFQDNYQSSPGAALKPGSHDFVTLFHEFGHAMGLAHPHDDGGPAGSGSEIFPGVSTSDDTGDFGLNQGVYTMMSYNDGWATRPTQPNNYDYGYQAGPMALDIMTLQYMYGANNNYKTGSDTYTLSGSNSSAKYVAIWDKGGTDTIVANADVSATIDLRAATALVAAGGGGYISYSKAIAGGFTIAKGVVIENATGSNLDDTLKGNSAINVLTGGDGKDTMYGNGGNDRFDFNSYRDGSSSRASADIIMDFSASDRIDVTTMDAKWSTSGDQDFTYKGKVAEFTGAAQLRYGTYDGDTYVYLNMDTDQAAECVIRFAGIETFTKDNFIL